MFYSLRDVQILIEQWRKHCKTKRPHCAFGYRSPDPETIIVIEPRPFMHKHSNWITQVGLNRPEDEIAFAGLVETTPLVSVIEELLELNELENDGAIL